MEEIILEIEKLRKTHRFSYCKAILDDEIKNKIFWKKQTVYNEVILYLKNYAKK